MQLPGCDPRVTKGYSWPSGTEPLELCRAHLASCARLHGRGKGLGSDHHREEREKVKRQVFFLLCFHYKYNHWASEVLGAATVSAYQKGCYFPQSPLGASAMLRSDS